MSCCYLPADNMDHFGEDEFPLGRSSPRRQLQGPRPTPLKVHKDSHKIKKPPIPPPQNHHGHHNQHHHHQQPPPQPLIIYTISPKVIHTNPCDFMSLVQRLTGPSTNNTATTNTSSGALSPAARFAAIEKTKPQHQHHHTSHEDSSSTSIAVADRGNTINCVEEEGEQVVGGDQYHHQQTGSTTSFPGILSPHPSTLPPISPNFFSPLPDPNSFNFLHDMSPLFNSNNNYNYNKNFIEATFVPSPTTNFLSSSPTVLTSPTLSFDLFNHFLDL